MDKRIKEKWLHALRSGAYQQGMGMLRSHDDKFCCLGVLCDIADPLGWSEELIDFPAMPAFAKCYAHRGQTQLPSNEFAEKVGVRDMAPALAGLNDVAGESFTAIAKFIEERL